MVSAFITSVASSAAMKLMEPFGRATGRYVLGPAEERALYGVLERAFTVALDEAVADTDADTAEALRDPLERWFSDPVVQEEMLSSVIELREPPVEILEERFESLDPEPPSRLVDLGRIILTFRHNAARNIEEETNEQESTLANMVFGGRLKALLRHVREGQSFGVHRGGSLPRRPDNLIGRDPEVEHLLGVVCDGPGSGSTSTGDPTPPKTVAVTGLPGVGKSSLTAELANRQEVTDRFPEGVLWASLGPAPELVSTIAGWSQALGGPDLRVAGGVAEVSSRLAAFLKDKELLIVVDDVYQAEHAAALKVLGRGVLLVSTRAPGVARELTASPSDVHGLDPLTVDEGLDLVLSEAPSLQGWQPEVIRELAEKLDGIPLFLKVAGRLLDQEAQTGLATGQFLEELRAKKEALLGEHAPAETGGFTGEQALTLRSLIQTSLGYLDDETKDAFSMLGTMVAQPATFELQAAEAVWNLEDGRDIVRALVSRGLVQPEGVGRFSIHSTLNLFAKASLGEEPHEPEKRNKRTEAQRRRAEYYAEALATAGESYFNGEQSVREAVSDLDDDWPNILSGREWVSSRYTGDQDAARLCIRYADSGRPWLHVRLDPAEHREWAKAAVGAARELGDRRAEASGLVMLGHALRRAGKLLEAKTACEGALALYQELGDESGRGAACGALASCHKYLENPEEAERLYKEQIRLSRSASRPQTPQASPAFYSGAHDAGARDEAVARGNLGVLYRDLERYSEAVLEIEKAIEIFGGINDDREAAGARANLGTVYHDQGDFQAAEQAHLEYLRVALTYKDQQSKHVATGNLGNVNRALGKHRKSFRYYRENHRLSRKLGLLVAEGMALEGIASARFELGQPEAAYPIYSEAVDLVRQTDTPRAETEILNSVTHFLLATGRPREALHNTEQALPIYERVRLPRHKADTLWQASLALSRTGDYPGAIRSGQKARRLYRHLGAPEEREVNDQLLQWRSGNP